MTSRDIIGLPPVTISLATVYYYYWFRLWKTILKTHKKFHTVSYHTDIVRGGCLSHIAPPITNRRFSPIFFSNMIILEVLFLQKVLIQFLPFKVHNVEKYTTNFLSGRIGTNFLKKNYSTFFLESPKIFGKKSYIFDISVKLKWNQIKWQTEMFAFIIWTKWNEKIECLLFENLKLKKSTKKLKNCL